MDESEGTDTDDVISRATLEALRLLATADGDLHVVGLCSEALAPRMALTAAAAAAQRRREMLGACEDSWRLYCARTGILVEPGPRITDDQIRRLKGIAQLEKDPILVSVCDRVLRSNEARRACEVAWRERNLRPVLAEGHLESAVRAFWRAQSPTDAQAPACHDCRWPPHPSVQHLESKRMVQVDHPARDAGVVAYIHANYLDEAYRPWSTSCVEYYGIVIATHIHGLTAETAWQ